VFSGPHGRYLNHSNWYQRTYKPAVVAAGLPTNLTFHNLRDTHVALCIAESAHTKAIQQRRGLAAV
jgi:integrase